MKLQIRILFFLVGLMALILVMLYTNIVIQESINELFRESSELFDITILYENLRAGFLTRNSEFTHFLTTEEFSHLDEYFENEVDITLLFVELKKFITDGESFVLLIDTQRGFEKVSEIHDDAITVMEQGKMTEEAKHDFEGLLVKHVDSVEELLDMGVGMLEVDNTKIRADIVSLNESFRSWSIIAIVGTLVISGSLIFFLLKSITRFFTELKMISKQISEGNYVLPKYKKRDTEFLDILYTFRNMIEGLQQVKCFNDETVEELEKQKAELERLDVLKEEFSSMVSHELKTPLTPIMGHCDLLMEDGTLGKLSREQIESVEEINRNAMRLETLIQDVLDAQKLDMTKMQFSKSSFSMNSFFDKIVADFEISKKNKSVKLINKNVLTNSVFTDETRLRQIMDNLIKNSLDFVPGDSGVIEIGSQYEENRFILYVKDNGIGISNKEQKKLFQKFYQIDTSAKREHGGTGLGLVIAKGIIEGLGGKIWVESEPSLGSTFFISIPIR